MARLERKAPAIAKLAKVLVNKTTASRSEGSPRRGNSSISNPAGLSHSVPLRRITLPSLLEAEAIINQAVKDAPSRDPAYALLYGYDKVCDADYIVLIGSPNFNLGLGWRCPSGGNPSFAQSGTHHCDL